jgi:rare lipoprotein A
MWTAQLDLPFPSSNGEMSRGVRIRVQARQLRRVHWSVAAVLVTIMTFAMGSRGQSGSPRPAERTVLRGDATYLADFFHGRESASGEIFDQRKMVAAHRSLPFGSRVHVTNLKNGRSVRVRIVDRGPYGRSYREGTIIDLSKAAARQLRMLHDGQVRVKVVVLSIGDGKRVERVRDS